MPSGYVQTFQDKHARLGKKKVCFVGKTYFQAECILRHVYIVVCSMVSELDHQASIQPTQPFVLHFVDAS